MNHTDHRFRMAAILRTLLRLGALRIGALRLGLLPAIGLTLLGTELVTAQVDPVIRGREAFSSQGEWDWYDANSDSIKPMSPPGLRSNQSSNGNAQGNGRGGNRQGAFGGSGSGGQGNGGGNGGSGTGGGGGSGFDIPSGGPSLGALGGVFNGIAITFTVVLLVIVIAGIVWAIMKMDFSKDEDEDELDEPEEVELAPVDKLPFEIDRSIGNFLDAARQAYQQQDFRSAIIYTFSHVLLTLDQHRLIRLTRGKTNRQYLAEIRERPELQAYFEQVMIPFEAVFFGDQDITRQEFEAVWNRMAHFQQNVTTPAPGGFPARLPPLPA